MQLPKGNNFEAKDTQKKPKECQKYPKGSQRTPIGSQKWAKGLPKCIKKSTFGKGREKVAKKVAAP